MLVKAQALPPLVTINPWRFARASGSDRLRQMMAAAAVGPIVRIRMAHRTFWLVQDPELVGHVLDRNHRNFRKSDRYAEVKPFLGEGLLTSEGEAWRRQRRRASPAFHHKRLPAIAAAMVAETRARLDRWEAVERRGQAFDVLPEMMALTLSVVTRCLYGEAWDVAGDFSRALAFVLARTDQRLTLPFAVPVQVPTPANLRFKQAKGVLDRYVFDMIGRRRDGRTSGADLLSMLMQPDAETGDVMSEAELRDEIMTMVLAGHETTANALAWTWYLLAKVPWVERAVRDEVASVLGSRDPAFEDLPRLSLTARVLQEAMRLYPPAWLIERQNLAADVLGGVPIAPGTRVSISPFTLHHSPELWDNPEGFDPDRFLPESVAARPKFAYIPFGGGPRLCIGNQFAQMEALIILAMTLQRYRLSLDPTRTVEPALMIVLRPKTGVWVRLKPA
jgi:cytochrome P450